MSGRSRVIAAWFAGSVTLSASVGVACTTAHSTTVAPAGAVHHFTDNWGSGLGCHPRGGAMALEGVVVVQPFGKGTDGAVLDTGTEQWVLSYRAEGALLDLDGVRVVARGRACDKQGEAVAGKHFDLESLTEINPQGE
jgi:hypothetical protein